MSSFLLGMVLLTVFGIAMLTTQSLGASLDSSSAVNNTEGLLITDNSGRTVIGTNLGTTSDISTVTLTLDSDFQENRIIDISLVDGNSVTIGSGSITCSTSPNCGTSVVISLSDTVTDVERDTLVEVIVDYSSV